MATVQCVRKWSDRLKGHNRKIRRYSISKPSSVEEWLEFLCVDVLVDESELQSLSEREQENHRREDIMISDVLGVHVKIYSKV